MNPFACRVVLRPRTTFEVLDLSFAVLREGWWDHLRLGLVVLALPLVAGSLVLARVDSDMGWAVFFGAWTFLPALQLPFTVLAARRLFAEEVSLREVLGTSVRSVSAWLAWPVVLTVMACAGSMSLGLLAVPVAALLIWLREVLALEGGGVVAGLRRALQLATEVPGTSLLGAGLLAAVQVWAMVVGELGFQAIVDFVLQIGTPFGSTLSGRVTPYPLWGLVLVQPLCAVFRLLLYVDARTTLEGWDLRVALAHAREAA